MPLPKTLSRKALAGAAAAVMLALGGCLPAQNPVTMTNAQLYSRDTRNQVHEFRFIHDSASYERVELARMDAFLSRYGVGADQIVAVSATGELAGPRQRAVLDALASRGVTARVVADRLTAPDAVVLLVQAPDILVGRCRPGEVAEVIDGQNLQLGGCATDYNLTRMVVDQNDLIEGKELGPADGAAMALGIQRYRAGEITPLRQTTTGD